MLLVLNSYNIYYKIQTYAEGDENPPISYSAVDDIMLLGDKKYNYQDLLKYRTRTGGLLVTSALAVMIRACVFKLDSAA